MGKLGGAGTDNIVQVARRMIVAAERAQGSRFCPHDTGLFLHKSEVPKVCLRGAEEAHRRSRDARRPGHRLRAGDEMPFFVSAPQAICDAIGQGPVISRDLLTGDRLHRAEIVVGGAC